MVDTTMDGLVWVRKQIEQADTDLLREMVKLFCAHCCIGRRAVHQGRLPQ